MMGQVFGEDFLERIVNVHWGKAIYLIIIAAGGNASSSDGPYGPAPGIGSVSISSEEVADGAEILDTFAPAGSGSTDGFTGCMTHGFGDPPEHAWATPTDADPTAGVHGLFGAVDNTCPWPGAFPQPPEIEITPINYERTTALSMVYLYRVPAGVGVVNVAVSGIAPPFHQSDPLSNEDRSISGGGTLDLFVYSTVRGEVTSIDQLLDIGNDGRVRPTEDDHVSTAVTSAISGQFSVNVLLDKTTAHAQIDNYGKKFQPYKVTLDHGDNVDSIPAQPPPRLGG